MVAFGRVRRKTRDNERVVDTHDLELDGAEHDRRVRERVELFAEDVDLADVAKRIHVGDLDSPGNAGEAHDGRRQAERAQQCSERAARGALPHDPSHLN
jgi:hypothetical protein